DDERQAILNYFRVATDHREAADSAELVNYDAAGEESIALYGHVSCEGYVVCDDDVVSEQAIGGYVRICDDQAVVADPRGGPSSSASVDGHAFADDGAIADSQVTLARLERDVLRLASKDGAFVDHAVMAD